MERDRGAVLTVRAAARGLIDFSKSDPRDVRWWRRSAIIIEALARDEDRALTEAAYAYQLALVGNGSLTKESFKASQQGARNAFNDICNALQPWVAKTTEELKSDSLESLFETYKQVYGDPNDPEVIAKMEESIASYYEWRRQYVEEETEDARVNRLLAERDTRHSGLRG